jgi:hypothetical protein
MLQYILFPKVTLLTSSPSANLDYHGISTASPPTYDLFSMENLPGIYALPNVALPVFKALTYKPPWYV